MPNKLHLYSTADLLTHLMRYLRYLRFTQALLLLTALSMGLLLFGCSSSRTASEPDEQDQTETTAPDQDNEQQQTLNGGTEPRTAEEELFDSFYTQYAELYNQMIQEYFNTQVHLNNRNYEMARASVLRAAALIPTVQIYELVVIILQRLNNAEELREWEARLQELRALREQGLFLTPDGRIVGSNEHNPAQQ